MALSPGVTGDEVWTDNTKTAVYFLLYPTSTDIGATTGEYSGRQSAIVSVEEQAPKIGPAVGIYDPEWAAIFAMEV